jgi:hypothetical protein
LQGTYDDPFASAFDIPTYFYVKPRIGGLIPLNKVEIGEVTIGDIPAEVWFDGKKYYDQVKITRTKEHEEIRIGKGFTLKPDGTFNSIPKGTLFEQIRDIGFFVEICNNPNKELTIGDFVTATVNEGQNKEQITRCENYLAYLLEVKNALEYFGVYCDFNYDEMTENDRKSVDTLIHISKGLKFKQNPSPSSSLFNIQIANLNIAFFSTEVNGEFTMESFFKIDDSEGKVSSGDGIENDASLYILLKRENLIKLSNLDYSVMKKSIKSKRYAPLYESMVNNLLLETLHAYDDTSNPELLDFAFDISSWLLENENIPVHILNYLQIKKRSQFFSDEDIESLMKIRHTTENIGFAVGACILLESFIEADRHFSKLSKVEQDAFREFPIYKLWKEHLPVIRNDSS